jgi:hypothetical protein
MNDWKERFEDESPFDRYEVLEFIEKELEQAYKQGFIDGGIAELTKGKSIEFSINNSSNCKPTKMQIVTDSTKSKL